MTVLSTPAPPRIRPEQFESIYADARGDATRIPWQRNGASPALVNWLNAVAPTIVRCGARVLVVGCGLGEDARELMHRGYEVTAFDCSTTAIDWARSIDPVNADRYAVADLFDPPARWRHRFDLVVEVNTIQSLPPDLRAEAVAATADFVSPHGRLLVICRGADDPAPADAGPPWPLTPQELREVTALAGLAPEGAIGAFDDDGDPPVRRMRAVFRRA